MNSTDILSVLDGASEEGEFPHIDDAWAHPITCRMLVFRSDTHWAILFEWIAYCEGVIDNSVYVFGNCTRPDGGEITFPQWVLHKEQIVPSSTAEIDFLLPELEYITLAGVKEKVIRDPAYYTAKGIQLTAPPDIYPWEFALSLLPEAEARWYRPLADITSAFQHQAPLFMELREWYHPPQESALVMPSETETFRMLANAIASGRKEDYQPKEVANNHWSYWQDL